MLVLRRKKSQELVIDENIVLHINHISKGSVSIGIDAPREVQIRRGEMSADEHQDRFRPLAAK